MHPKTYLVTGGAGFIGSNFVRYMLGAYDDIRIVNVDMLTYAGNLANLADLVDDERHSFARVDIRDAKTLDKLFTRYAPDYVVNFAAESHVDRSIADPRAFSSTNVEGTLALLQVAKADWEEPDGSYGDHKFLQVSTDEVYGSLPLDDASALCHEMTPLSPHSPYSASKAAADLFVMAYRDTYGLPVNITRCSNNYGPYQFPEKLIPLMIGNALAHEPLPVYGDGLNVRDWLYVEDHCRAIDLVLHDGRLGEVYNVGGHNERANIQIVRTIVEQVAEVTGDAAIGEGLITYVADRPGHDRRYGIAPDKIAAELGWQPETAFEDGIAATIRWYLDHQDWLAQVRSGAYLTENERLAFTFQEAEAMRRSIAGSEEAQASIFERLGLAPKGKHSK